MISKEIMLKIANLERKDFLKTVNYLFLLHITDNNWIDEQQLSDKYIEVLEEFVGVKN
jgi:hypothetical protein